MDFTKTGRFKRVSGDRNLPPARSSHPGMMLRRPSGAVSRIRVRSRQIRAGAGIGSAARAVLASLPIARIAAVVGILVIITGGVFLGVNAYAQSKQINVTIDNGVITVNSITTARTVRELLAQNNVKLGPDDEVTPPLNARLKQGMAVTINKAMIIFITTRGEMQQVYMTGGTVQDALSKAQINFDDNDEISPAPATKLKAGIRIKHVAVDSVIISEMHKIPYDIYYQESSNVKRGKYVVAQRGSEGVKERDIQVTYKDGVEVNRVEISNSIKSNPVDRIILKGTKSDVVLINKPSDTPKPSSSDDDDDKPTKKPGSTKPSKTSTPSNTPKPTPKPTSGPYAHVKPEDLKIPSVPSSFESILYMQITAYTHTGRKTARGNWPQYTRTLKKPGTIAVDPNAIPYGTLLYVTGYGYCVAEDTGANDTDSSRMGDVFMNTTSECYRWGRRRDVKVYVVSHNFQR